MKKILDFLEKYGVYSLLLLSLCEFALMTPFGFGMGCFFLFSYFLQMRDKQK
jgi:hypothetical protein